MVPHRTRLLALSAALAFGALACDDDSKGGSSSSIAPTQVYEALGDTYCHVLQKCDLGDDDFLVLSAFARNASPSACRAFVMRVLAPDFDIEAGLASGALVLDGEKYAQCLATVKSSCNFQRFSECEGIIDGKVPIGGACTDEIECAGDAFCYSEDFDCPGVCKARIARGAACDFYDDCSAVGGESTCSFESDVCVPVVRVTNAAVGARCGFEDSPTEEKFTECAAGAVCVYDAEGTTSTCVAKLASGAACEDKAELCPGGEVCLPTGPNTATCQKLPFVGAGEACNEEIESGGTLAVCSAFDQMTCFEGKCTKWGDGSVGSVCGSVLDFGSVCAAANYCADDGKCAAKKADAAACEEDQECVSGNCVSSSCEAIVCQ